MNPIRRWLALGLFLFLVSITPALAEVRETDLWWTPDVVTKGGEKIDFLLHLIFWLTAVVFFLTQAVFIYFLIKYRRKRGVAAHYSHGNNSLELIWTTIPAVIFIGLWIGSNHVWWKDVRSPAPADSIKIDIVAYQYGWHIRNPGRDGKLGEFSQQMLTKDNIFGTKGGDDPEAMDDYQSEGVLTVPLGKPVNVILRSLDVIHAFYVPEFRMYQDIVPGRQIEWVWFETTRTGNFELACSQLCGAGHYNMKARINVVTVAEYDKLVAEKSKAARDESLKKQTSTLPPIPADIPPSAVAASR